MTRRISIVVPALDEGDQIEATLRGLRVPEVREVIVVDGGSRDDTVARAAASGARTVSSAPGRATQMNVGAAAAEGEILLFLHADTRMPQGFAPAVVEAIAGGAVGGRFDVELRGDHFFLPVIAALMNFRSRHSGIATGDQALFVTRETFDRLGGFPALRLMEDIAFTRALKRAGAVAALRLRVSTSARRWERRGVFRTILLMWSLRLAYAVGIDADRLAGFYPREPPRRG